MNCGWGTMLAGFPSEICAKLERYSLNEQMALFPLSDDAGGCSKFFLFITIATSTLAVITANQKQCRRVLGAML